MKERKITEERLNGKNYPLSSKISNAHNEIRERIVTRLAKALEDTFYRVSNGNMRCWYHWSMDDYCVPDVMIYRKAFGQADTDYRGVPRFLVEILSPSTIQRDRLTKMEIYEWIMVGEYWIISPVEKSIEIYYYKRRGYVLENAYIFDGDKDSTEYNGDVVISLRDFAIHMTLKEIFDT